MQVDVCFLRFGRGRQYNGLPLYRKNIIAFPQELSEVKQLLNFWTSLSENDVVNVEPPPGTVGDVKRARIMTVQPSGFDVKYRDYSIEFVKLERIRQRVQLPWRPEDLREHFIVLRRRIGRTEQHLEKDLRVRRKLLKRILLFLTKRGNWRPGHGEETLHMYYDAFDLREDHEIETIFPEDGVPLLLNFQDLREDDFITEISFTQFEDWLIEGKFNCDVAQAMLHTWMHDMQGSTNETLRDFFDQLFDDYIITIHGEAPPKAAIPILFLSSFVR